MKVFFWAKAPFLRNYQVIILLCISLILVSCQATKFAKLTEKHREDYKLAFQSDDHAPLKDALLDSMRFFPANKKYEVEAKIRLNDEPLPFDVHTSSGKIKSFHKYADARFELSGNQYNVALYQNLKLQQIPKYKNYLFLMFNDLTNGESTYGGGRYIDLSIDDIEGNLLVIDFNKCYNPYCAYSSGYNCPIPPTENMIEAEIKAGEMLYVGSYLGKKH